MKDRRHEPRIETLNLAHVGQVDAAGHDVDLTVGRTLDLSHDGVRIELAQMVPIRSRLNISLAVGDHVVEVVGQVKSITDMDSEGYAHGIQFVDVSDDARRVLALYLRAKTVPPGAGQ
jgi:hypothetical protein